ncbi:MAG TPA: CBS domain-containing protein [Candidatus Limnocylindrales bacterium]|nr:CBS domain-containing protein [Candidatus Limnocylindrales bacterium]
MLCPVCRHDNFEGEDTCASCGADLATSDTPQSVLEYDQTILGDHLHNLGLSAMVVVTPDTGVAEAIRTMHDSGGDCLLVCDGDRLVGIFTDRDAVVKAADKRLQLYTVADFMTPDPVVLREEDTLAVAVHKMAVGEFRHIPIVTEAGSPIGVVAAADVFRHIAAALG